jgi:hypothetical protein
MSAGIRFTSRSSPLPDLIAENYGCCPCPRRKITISLMQGKEKRPLPPHPLTDEEEKLSGMCPV